jgi:hypothetical protein
MDQEPEEGWYRRKVGRRIEKGVNRLLGIMLILIALLALYLSVSSDSFAISSHWPGLVIAALLLLAGRYCLKAKESVIDGFGEEPSDTGRKTGEGD